MTSPWNNELDYNEYITLANNSFCVPTAYRTITMKKPFKSYTFLEAGEPYQVAVSIRESLNLYSRQNLKNFHIFKSILSDQSLVKGLRRALNFSEEEIYSYHQSVTTVSTTYGITTQDTEVTQHRRPVLEEDNSMSITEKQNHILVFFPHVSFFSHSYII